MTDDRDGPQHADAGLRSRLELADWRRAVAALYGEVRAIAAADPPAAWERWRLEREALYRGHPQSPVPPAEREAFRARHWPYDERLRFDVRVEAIAAAAPVAPSLAAPVGLAGIELPNSGAEAPRFDRLGEIRLRTPEGNGALPLFWMHGYAGGLFVPFRDGTSGAETYGAGRYVLDTAKGADLGGDAAAGTIVVDLNFAYQPSCAFDPAWACPLAPPESRLAFRIEAGERLR